MIYKKIKWNPKMISCKRIQSNYHITNSFIKTPTSMLSTRWDAINQPCKFDSIKAIECFYNARVSKEQVEAAWSTYKASYCIILVLSEGPKFVKNNQSQKMKNMFAASPQIEFFVFRKPARTILRSTCTHLKKPVIQAADEEILK